MSYLANTPEGLLPCPHCGGEAEARDGSSTRPYIRCKSCGCRTGSSWDMDKLKEAWNRRAGGACERGRCVAEVKVDGEQLEKLVHDAAVELTGIDRDALLALADDIDKQTDGSMFDIWLEDGHYIARRIREALGADDGR